MKVIKIVYKTLKIFNLNMKKWMWYNFMINNIMILIEQFKAVNNVYKV